MSGSLDRLTLEPVPGCMLISMPAYLRIGQLARLTNLSPDSLRHYGRLGLIASTRTPGRFREYDPDAVRRVQIIQAALAIGFSLDELADIFARRRSGRSPCAHVRRLAGEKLAELTRRLDELTRLHSHLTRTLSAWDRSMAVAGKETPARLLESLLSSPTPARMTRRPVGARS